MTTLSGTFPTTSGLTTGVLAGDQIFGVAGIPDGDTVTAATATTVTLQNPTTAAGTAASLPFYAPPAFPPGAATPLVAATGGSLAQPGVPTGYEVTPPAAAYVNLVDAAPAPVDQTVSIGQSQSANITLSATAGTYPVDPNGFSIVGGSPQTIGSLTITQVGTSAVINTTNTASAPETDTFQFNACDTLPAGNGGPVCSATPGTITVKIGTPPVIQPFTEQVTGGLLVLSCDSPSNYVTVGAGNVGTTANPLLQCPEFQFPAITLNGLEQQVTGTTGNSGGNPSASNPGTIFISDNRGSPTDQWTLSAAFVPTAIGSGDGENPNTSCAGVDAFCNSTVGPAALNTATNGAHNGQIAPNYLQVSNITCTADATGGLSGPDATVYNPPNLNPDATPTSGGNFGSPTVDLCSASAGQSGGTFLYNATYTLTIPESVYAGNYYGSISYTIG